MRIIRQGVFETNSSSAHSLTFKKGDKYIQHEFKEGVFQFRLEDLDRFVGEPSPAVIFTSFEDRIRYILGSIFYHFSRGEPKWVEISEECYLRIKTLNADILENNEDEEIPSHAWDLKEYNRKFYHLISSYELSFEGRQITMSLEKFLRNYVEGFEGFEFHNTPAIMIFYNNESEDKYEEILPVDLKSTRYAVNWFYNIAPESSERFELENPIPLTKLLDGEWMKDFIFSESTCIRVSDTLSPLDPELIAPPIPSYISLSDQNQLRRIVNKYVVIYNSCDLVKKSSIRLENYLNVFDNIETEEK